MTSGSEERPEQDRIAPAARSPRLAAGALVPATLLALVVSFAGIFQHELWTPDEPREAEIGREMYEAGGSAMPTLGGEPFLEKPPLFVWTMAASYSLFGVSAASARVPAALFSAAALLAAFVLGRRAAGRGLGGGAENAARSAAGSGAANAAGLLSIVVLATTSEFWSVSHRSINDTALTAFVAWCHVCLLRAWERRRNAGTAAGAAGQAGAGGGVLDWLAAGVSAGLAFLTKGVIGPVLALAPPLLAIFLLGERRLALALTLRAGLASLGAIALFGVPWAIALARHDGGWGNVHECVVAQVLARSLGGTARISGHTHAPWYYLLQLPLSCAPWIVAAPALVASDVLRRGEAAALPRRVAATLLVGVLLLSIPSGKRGSYLVPLLPLLAALFGAWLAQAHASRGIERVTARILIGLVALASLVLALFAGGVQMNLLDRWPQLAPFAAGELATIRWGLVVAGLVTFGVALREMTRTAAGAASPRAGESRPLARAVALPLVLLLLVSHVLVRPLLDPVKGLKAGAIAVAREVPEGEPLFAFEPDETTLAVLPFYAGRLVREVRGDRWREELAAAHTNHLLVMDHALGRLPELTTMSVIIRRIVFTPTRAVRLLEILP